MTASADDGLAQSVAPLARVRAMSSSLPPSDRRVAEVISEWADDVLARSITEVAQAAGVAESTVIRACKRLGFTGFQGLKLAIAQDRRPELEMVADEISADDSVADVVAKLFAASASVLSEAATSVNTASVEAVIEAIAAGGRVLFAGLGPSSPLTQDAAYRFRCLGVQADAPVDCLTQHLAARLLRPGDVCVVISHTGATRETLPIVAAAREAGAVTAAVTSFARSPLTEAVDYPLVAGGRQLGFRVEAMASRLAHLCVLDALYVGVAMRTEPDALRALELHHQVATEHQL
jgi:RpiR family transcriptional regulator, carbohydrate utilization regulator